MGCGAGALKVKPVDPALSPARLSPEEVRLKNAQLRVDEEPEGTSPARTSCEFYFVHAHKILNCSDHALARFQKLLEAGDWLVKIRITLAGACRGIYDNILAVSHRWESPESPDVNGVQLATIKAYLQEHRHIEFVWFDWSSMPQGDRTTEEDVMFRQMLTNVNLVYLGCQVLLIVDMSYMSRFWTMFEAWLSMRTATTVGLMSTSAEDQKRCSIVCVHKAQMKYQAAQLQEIWGFKTAAEAHEFLSSPDVTVTNQRDKDTQLVKLLEFNSVVKQAVLKEGVTFSVGPKPTSRTWRDEFTRTPNVGSIERRIENMKFVIDWKVAHGWPREQAEAYTIVTGAALDRLSRAICDRSDHYAACTHMLFETLASKAIGLVKPPEAVYSHMLGPRGLADNDPAWMVLLEPACSVGDCFVTNSPTKWLYPTKHVFPNRTGFHSAQKGESGGVLYFLEDSPVVRIDSRLADDDGLHSAVPVSEYGCDVPPMTLVKLERIDGPDEWEVNGHRIQQRRFVVSISYMVLPVADRHTHQSSDGSRVSSLS